jgi:hypothetical protein
MAVAGAPQSGFPILIKNDCNSIDIFADDYRGACPL